VCVPIDVVFDQHAVLEDGNLPSGRLSRGPPLPVHGFAPGEKLGFSDHRSPAPSGLPALPPPASSPRAWSSLDQGDESRRPSGVLADLVTVRSGSSEAGLVSSDERPARGDDVAGGRSAAASSSASLACPPLLRGSPRPPSQRQDLVRVTAPSRRRPRPPRRQRCLRRRRSPLLGQRCHDFGPGTQHPRQVSALPASAGPAPPSRRPAPPFCCSASAASAPSAAGAVAAPGRRSGLGRSSVRFAVGRRWPTASSSSWRLTGAGRQARRSPRVAAVGSRKSEDGSWKEMAVADCRAAVGGTSRRQWEPASPAESGEAEGNRGWALHRHSFAGGRFWSGAAEVRAASLALCRLTPVRPGGPGRHRPRSRLSR
jgi:hypothetical protein